jgi:hypothetical protein
MAESTHDLSLAAESRMRAMLPELLGAVRWRRRRRYAVRAGGVAAVVAFAVVLWPRGDGAQRGGRNTPVDPAPRVAICEVVRTDPRVAQWRVASAVPAEWYLDDDGLQAMLREGQRPDGIVRVRDKVLVASAAVDPFPGP